jgi:hypothetical protein
LNLRQKWLFVAIGRFLLDAYFFCPLLMPKSSNAVGNGKKNLQEILKIYNPLKRIVLAFI